MTGREPNVAAAPEPPAAPEWMTSARWPRTHLIVGASARFVGSTTQTYRMTACGRRVRVERLEPGVATKDRCDRCRANAPGRDLLAELHKSLTTCPTTSKESRDG